MSSQSRFRSIVGLAVVALVVSVLPLSAPAAAFEEPVPPLEIEQVIEDPTPDIVGGNEADPAEYPFVVDVELNILAGYTSYPFEYSRIYTRRCAGTLIAPEWVLTAGHCFNTIVEDDDMWPFGTFRGVVHVDDVTLHVGRHDLTTTSGETFAASGVFVHPDYEGGVGDPHDIALIRMAGASTAEAAILAAPSDAGLYGAGATGRAIGWGALSVGGPLSDVLMEVNIPFRSDAECTAIYSADSDPSSVFFPDTELCAGYSFNGGGDTCGGDSGGPILAPGSSGWLQAGITSWGVSCSTAYPGVYTEVAAYRAWIDNTMNMEPLVAARASHMSATATQLVYWIDDGSQLTPYSVRITGGDPVALGTPVAGSQVVSELTADGSTLVYGVASGSWPFTIDLFAVPVAGPASSRVLLLDDYPWDDFGYTWKLNPNGEEILYTEDWGSGDFFLLRVSLATGETGPVSGAVVQFGDVKDFKITSDGNHVVFLGDVAVNGRDELTVADLDTGSVSALAVVADGDVEEFTLSPDGTVVAFTASVASDDIGLFSVPLGGSPEDAILIAEADALERDMASGGGLAVTEDSSRVIFTRTDSSWDDSLHSVPVAGPPSAEVDLTPNSSWISSWEVTPDGEFVVMDATIDFVDGLFTVPVEGPSSGLVTILDDGWFEYEVSPGGDMIAYAPGDTEQLTLVPTGGPASAGEQIADATASQFFWSPAGTHIVFSTWWRQMYAVRVSGDRVPFELTRAMQIDGNVLWGDDSAPTASPDDRVLAYLADARIDGEPEVWLAPLYTVWDDAVSGDFSGDGLVDVAMFDVESGLWQVGVSDGSVVVFSVWSDVATFGWDTVLVGDYNGDGRDDIAMYVNATGHWWVLVSDGLGFVTSSWSKFTSSLEISSQFVGDFNGDGLDDLANFEVSTGKWWVSLSTGSAFFTRSWSRFSASLVWPSQLIGDFNGDGLDDVANYHVYGSGLGRWFVSTSTGSRFGTSGWLDMPDAPEFFNQFAGDFNGDGFDDIANYDNVSGEWLVALSTGSGFSEPQVWSRFTSAIVITDQFVGDFNGDGADDVANFEVTTGKWWVSLSRPDVSLFYTRSWSRFTASLVWDPQLIGDLNGDGLDDLINYLPESRRWFGSLSRGYSFYTRALANV